MKTLEKQIVEQKPTPAPKRRRVIWIGASLLVIVLLSGSYWLFFPRVQPLILPVLPAHLNMSDLGLTNWKGYQQPLAQDPLNDPRLPTVAQKSSEIAPLEHAAGLALLKQQPDKGLAYLQAALESDPDNLRYANDYRLALRDLKRYEEEEKFFTAQLAQHNSTTVRVNLALAYVDQMRSCPTPPDGLVCQAQYSSKSISQLDIILAEHPYDIIARYARGLNHLYWPTLMGHLPKAQQDLSYAVALTATLQAIDTGFSDDAYAALGDVFAKDSQIDAARNVWLNGLQVTPDSALLKSRLNIAREKLTEAENGPLRGLGVYVETDLSLFWHNER
jgi:tetratricopeptide (TPR) repeat protein